MAEGTNIIVNIDAADRGRPVRGRVVTARRDTARRRDYAGMGGNLNMGRAELGVVRTMASRASTE